MQETLVLLVEDCLVTGLAADRVLAQALPGARIFRAQSCYEARLLLGVYDFALFVLDVHLPDGCGLDLIRPIIGIKPNAKIIVITADRAQDLQDRVSAFGVQYFLRKPFPPDFLGNAARHSVNQDGPEEPGSFTASLNRLSVLEIIQLKCLAAATTRLDVSSHHTYHSGIIHLADGEIIHGEVRDEFLRLVASGEQALAHILGWRAGNVKELTPSAMPERSIFEPWQSLLLNVAQQCDERSEQAVPA